LPGLRQVAGGQNRSQDRLGKCIRIPHDGERTKFAKFSLPYKTGLLADPGHMIALAAMALAA
jgi:hypothetical protein